MKMTRVLMISMMGGISLNCSTFLIAGGDGDEQMALASPGHRTRFGQLFHRSSSNMSATSSSGSNHHSDSGLIVGSLDSIEIGGSSPSASTSSKIKILKKFLSRSSRRMDVSSSPRQSQSLSGPADAISVSYGKLIERAEHALLGLMKVAPEIFLDGDSDIRGLNEIDAFLGRFESIQHKLNTYCKRIDPNFAVSYMKTLSINFAKVSNTNVNPWHMYKHLGGIYTHLGTTVEDGISLSCADCRTLLEQRQRSHPEEEALLRQVEYLFRNSIAKQEFDILLQGGVQELLRLKKIKPEKSKQEIEHYLYLITFTNGMREELLEFKRNNPTSIKSPLVVHSTHDLSSHAFSLDD